MNYSQLLATPVRALDPEEAARYVGSKQLLSEYEKAGWLKPYARRVRLTRYDIRDLDACIDRHKVEGEPVKKER